MVCSALQISTAAPVLPTDVFSNVLDDVSGGKTLQQALADR